MKLNEKSREKKWNEKNGNVRQIRKWDSLLGRTSIVYRSGSTVGDLCIIHFLTDTITTGNLLENL